MSVVNAFRLLARNRINRDDDWIVQTRGGQFASYTYKNTLFIQHEGYI